MRLESARSLKAELMSEDLWKGIRKPRSVRARTPEEPFERSVVEFVPMAGLFGSRTRSTNEIRTEIQRRIREGKEAGGPYRVPSHRPARAPSVARQRPAPLAIGICGRQGSCKLALRVHDAIPGVNTVLDRVSRRAPGEVDVRFVGRVVKQIPWRHRRNRPLRIGGSVGHVKITAGTLGCFVTPRDGNAEEDFILSNDHLLANENKARKGDSIVQPGPDDGGRTAKDKVGSLARFVRLRKRHNVADAATAELLERIECYYNFLQGLGPIRGVRTNLPEIVTVHGPGGHAKLLLRCQKPGRKPKSSPKYVWSPRPGILLPIGNQSDSFPFRSFEGEAIAAERLSLLVVTGERHRFAGPGILCRTVAPLFALDINVSNPAIF